MEYQRLLLAVFVGILVLASGCVDMAFTTSVNSAGDVDKFQIQLNMTTAMYAMLDGMATQSGSLSFKDAMQHPRNATGTTQGFDVQEVWDKESGRVKVTLTARDLAALEETNYLSVNRDGDYLIFRHDLSSSTAPTQQSFENPFANEMESMFTVSYYLTMPGEIVDSNADSVRGNQAEWHRTTTKMPSIYAKSKVSVLPSLLFIGLGAMGIAAIGVLGVSYRRRGRTGAMPTPDPEAILPPHQWAPSYPAAHPQVAPVQVVPHQREAIRYVPYTRTRDPTKIRRKQDTSQRLLKTFLIGGTILFVVLLSAAMVQSFLAGTDAPAAIEAQIPLEPTRTVLPTTAPTAVPISYAMQTQRAGTLSPYSVDPASITANPYATKYIAPGYRSGEQPSGSSIMVHVTPYPLETFASMLTVRSSPPTTTLTRTTTKTTIASTVKTTTVPGTVAKTTTIVTLSPSPSSPPLVDPPEVEEPSPCNCDGDTYNCGDSLAQTCYGYCLAQGKGDVHRLDADNDGIPCEGGSPPVAPSNNNTSTNTPIVPPKPTTYTITVLSVGIGSVIPSGKVIVNEGESVTFRMIPDPSIVTPHMTQSGTLVYNLVQIDPTSMDIPDYADPDALPNHGVRFSPRIVTPS